MEYTASYLEVAPGLNIFYRDFPGRNENAPAILCLHGLTRNGEDFFPLINSLEKLGLAGNYRFIVPDMLGRGLSDYDPNPNNYVVPTYTKDCWQLLDHLKIEKCLLVGTSMGGIMTMHMHQEQPNRIAGVLLNDIGTIVVKEGLIYILSYLGRQMTESNWEKALQATKQRLAHEYPNIGESAWEELAKRSYSESGNGDWILRYDPNIRLPLLDAYEAETQLDLWDIFLAIDKPILCLRGALSRLFTKELGDEMEKRSSHCTVKKIKDRGHVPLLDEPETISYIREWLSDIG